MGNQAGIIIRNVKNELFHSAKRLILNEVKGIECLPLEWAVEHLVLRSPQGDVLEIKSTSLFVVAELLHKST